VWVLNEIMVSFHPVEDPSGQLNNIIASAERRTGRALDKEDGSC
jgi:hypothetical protein